jgi:uncharacterized protein
MNIKITRLMELAKEPQASFFLWGPRQAGKSFLLKEKYPDSIYIDMLKTNIFLKYLEAPYLLREELELKIKKSELDKSKPIIVDEVQKVPLILDEVHYLIENHDLKFILCGSSARKLKRGQANLLGGRALRYELYGLCMKELGELFNLKRALNQGYLPSLYLNEDYIERQEAYVKDYLKEEVASEALVRNLEVFSEFLRIASFSDSELINYSNIARDSGISASTVKEYFLILEDTLIGSFLPAYKKKPKRRITQAPKFYFFDVGVVNYLAKRKNIEEGSELFGKAFENWIYHELRTYNAYTKARLELSYWRLTTGIEVDFIINDMECAIEVKAIKKIHDKHLKNLRELKKDHPELKKLYFISLVEESRITEDDIEILNYRNFIEYLWQGKLL